VSQLKRQIAARTYRVDSQAVAREMLFKLRMMALVRKSANNPSQFRG
jgi:Anti-sigma-28 factor, FlgM